MPRGQSHVTGCTRMTLAALALALVGCATVQSRVAAGDLAGACLLADDRPDDYRFLGEELAKHVHVKVAPLTWTRFDVGRNVQVAT